MPIRRRRAARRPRRRAAVRSGTKHYRRVFRPLAATRQGNLYLTRKLDTVRVFASTDIQGVAQLQLPTGVSTSLITLGTPVQILSSANYQVPFTMTFRMSDIINYTDITNLADQYKINWVKIKVMFNNNANDVNSPASLPVLYYITDHDDAGMSTPTQLRERMGLITKPYTGSRVSNTIVVRPKVAPLIYSEGVGGAGYSIPLRASWLNSQYPSTPHYGVRGYFDNFYLPGGGKSNVVNFTLDITMGISAKDLL